MRLASPGSGSGPLLLLLDGWRLARRLRAVAARAGGPLRGAFGRLPGRLGGPGRGRPWGRPTAGWRRAARTRAAALRRLAHLGLAVGADLPARVERLAADGARLLEPAQAAGAAQERL